MAGNVICPIPKIDNRVEDFIHYIEHEGANLANSTLDYASQLVTQSVDGIIIVTRHDRQVERYCICRTFGSAAEQVAYHNPPPVPPSDDEDTDFGTTESKHSSTDSGSDMDGLELYVDRSGSETYYDSDC